MSRRIPADITRLPMIPIIRYPRFKQLSRLFWQCAEMTERTGEPQCMALEGQPGVGKSTLVQDVLRAYPRLETRAGTHIPVFYMMIPSPATVKSVASVCLVELGDPAGQKGPQWSMDQRLRILLPGCGVRLAILDDFHHLIDRDRNRVIETVSDWLKVLIKTTRVTFVVTGLEGSIDQILDSNPQLSRLFAIRETLRPFDWDTQGSEFVKFIEYVEKALDKSISTKLSRTELVRRIYMATHGLVGNVMNLMRYASLMAHDKDVLELPDLAWAFQTRLARQLKTKVNPFVETTIKAIECDQNDVRIKTGLKPLGL